MSSRVRLFQLLVAVLALCALFAAPAQASRIDREEKADAHASAFKTAPADLQIPVRDPAPPPGAQVLKYKFGPLKIQPGQNFIDIDVQKERPNVDGWIVGFRPGLVDAKTGKNPPVSEVHLHHAVWLVDFKPTFAAGEEKTNFNAPEGFGWRYTTKQTWMINHMIHDLVGAPHEVNLTYTLYFIPDTAPEAAGIKEIDAQWMDVQGIKPYPVFNALKGSGTKGKFTYPDQAKNPYPDRPANPRNQWVVDHDATLVTTARAVETRNVVGVAPCDSSVVEDPGLEHAVAETACRVEGNLVELERLRRAPGQPVEAPDRRNHARPVDALRRILDEVERLLQRRRVGVLAA